MKKLRSGQLLAILSPVLGLVPLAHAANTDYFWDPNHDGSGGSGTWDTAATNWDLTTLGGTASTFVSGATSAADFDYTSGSGGTVSLGSNLTVNTINFNKSGYDIAGSFALKISSAGTVNTVADATFDTLLDSTTANWTKIGTGTLTINSQNTMTTGTATINVGTLALKFANALGTEKIGFTGGALAATTSALDMSANAVTIGAGGGTTSGAFALTLGAFTNNGTVTFNIDTNTTFGGNTAGATTSYLQIASGNTGKSFTLGGTGVHGAGNVTINSIIADSSTAGVTGKLVYNGSGTLTLAAVNTFTGGLTLSGGTTNVLGSIGNSQIQINVATLSLQNASAVSQNTITVTSGGTLNETVINALSGSASLNVNAGTVNLTKANNYTGTTSVVNGASILQLSDVGAAASSAISMSAGTIQLRADADTTFSAASLTVTGNSTINADQLTVAGSGKTLGFGPATLASTITFTSGNNYTIGLGATTLSAGTTLLASTANVAVGSVTGQTFNVTLDGSTFANTIGNITTSGQFSKKGSGTWTLTGSDTITGLFKIGASATDTGTLVVNSTLTNTGVATVNNTATIAGSGTLGLGTGNLLTITNGHLAPGPTGTPGSTGIFTVTGSQTATATSGNNTINLTGVNAYYDVDLNGTTAGSGYDQLAVVGTVGISSNLTVTIGNSLTLASGQVFTIINNDGSDAVLGTFAGLAEGATALSANGFNLNISYVGNDGNDVTLATVAVAPEPTSLVFLGLGALALGRKRVRKGLV